MRPVALSIAMMLVLLTSSPARAAPPPGSLYRFQVVHEVFKTGMAEPKGQVGELIALVRHISDGELTYSIYVKENGLRKAAVRSASLEELRLSLSWSARDEDRDGFAEVFEVEVSGPDEEFFTGSTFCLFIRPTWEEHEEAWLASAAEVRSLMCVRSAEASAGNGTFRLAVVAGVEQEISGRVRQAAAMLLLSISYDEQGVLLGFRRAIRLMFIGEEFEHIVEVLVRRSGQSSLADLAELATVLLMITLLSGLVGATVALYRLKRAPLKSLHQRGPSSGCASS